MSRPLVHLVGHDAGLTGAPMVQLFTARWLAESGLCDLSLSLLGGGGLLDDLTAAVPEHELLQFWDEFDRRSRRERVLSRLGLGVVAERLVRARLRQQQANTGRADVVLVNSAASLGALAQSPPTAPVVLFVHELAYVLESLLDAELRNVTRTLPVRWIAASQEIADNLAADLDVPAHLITVVPAFLESGTHVALSEPDVPPLVLGCGFMQWRKGPDLFVRAASAHRRLFDRPARWVWVGHADPDVEALVRSEGVADVVELVPPAANPSEWFDRCSVFALPSREDPFPLVALEALRSARPIVCFEGSGGIPALIRGRAGKVVPMPDVDAFAAAIDTLLGDDDLRSRVGAAGPRLVNAGHTSATAGPQIWRVLVDAMSAAG